MCLWTAVTLYLSNLGIIHLFPILSYWRQQQVRLSPRNLPVSLNKSLTWTEGCRHKNIKSVLLRGCKTNQRAQSKQQNIIKDVDKDLTNPLRSNVTKICSLKIGFKYIIHLKCVYNPL